MTPALAMLISGCSFAVGVIVGLIAGWRSRRGDVTKDATTFRAEMALAERRTEAKLRGRYGLAPKAVRQ